jgi:hypothetical protein
VPPKWWDLTMSRVIAVVACGLTLAACSASMPSLNLSFLKSSPTTEALRIESDPPGADAKTSQGQSCRTPCELTVQTGGELSVTLALNGYQPQTVTVQQELAPSGQSDPQGPGNASRLSPNPVYVELQPALMTPPAKKPAAKKKKPATVAAHPAATPAPAATAAAPAALPTPVTEPAASATNFPWPSR